MATNIADLATSRKIEALAFLSVKYPSVHISEIQKLVDALERVEEGVQNDDFDLTWIYQSTTNPSFPTAIQTPLPPELALAYPNEINDHPSQPTFYHTPIEPLHLGNMMGDPEEYESFSAMLDASFV